MTTFSEISLLPQIQKSLEALGFTTPTEIQSKTIPVLLQDLTRDVHAQAQTGTGKTLAFGIPLLHAIDVNKKVTQGLVIAPTRELVLQIYESIKEVSRDTGIELVPIYGGMAIDRQIASIKRGAQIIIGTPGRLNDHLRRKTLSLKDLKVLVLDEADIMLDMGFRQEVDVILSSAPDSRAIWLFSATILDGIKQLIDSHMRNVLSIRAIQKGAISSQIEQYFCVVPKTKRLEAIVRFIQVTPDFYGIVFCQTKLLTSEVAEQLASKGFRVNCLHGDMKQALRNQVIKGFKAKDFNILVATDVAARGIDISDLTHVINYTIPQEIESYVHRIGRTGRAGKQGIAIVLASPAESFRIKRLKKVAQAPLQEIPIPPKEAIIASKMAAVSDFIELSKKHRVELSAVHKALEALVSSFTQEEMKRSLVIALEDIFFKGGVYEDFDTAPISVDTPQEICMSIGHMEGIDEQGVRDYLASVCKLMPKEISKVRVLNKRTFISIPEGRLQDCLEQMKKHPMSGPRHRVFLVEDAVEGRGRDRERVQERRGGDRRDTRSRGGDERMPMRRRRR